MRFDDVLTILNDVPDYQVFLTVDELKASTHQLANRYPDTVEILPIGHSRQGDPIEAIKIGDGPRQALLFAMPHPNEPIGSMMLEYLSLRLAEDDALRESLGYTWYLVKCIDPDGTRLNEGWFKGPFSLENYARHYYRPPAYQQVAWTFPIDYKTLHFHGPLPETRALMALIEQVRPDFMYSLHNSDFGGVYFYLWEAAPPLYEPFHKLVESQGLPLHRGEPEMPYEVEYASAIYKDSSITAEYDYLEEQTGTDPAEIITGGTLSFEYVRAFCDPFTLICEMPYFYHPAISDTSTSDMVRRDAILQAIEEAKEDVSFLKEQYESVKSELTVPSPFRDAIEETLRTFLAELAAEENWARTDPKTAEMATVAEKFDNLVIQRSDRLFGLGMFVRMLDAQIAATGESPSLSSAREAAKESFEARAADLEAELDYTVVPIQKLVRVQLGSALLAADYAAGRQAQG
ncbi:MAG: M14 family zinc carboxypeptidase [Anaerolineae bacterium]